MNKNNYGILAAGLGAGAILLLGATFKGGFNMGRAYGELDELTEIQNAIMKSFVERESKENESE